MARVCAKCGKKFGMLSEAPYELHGDCVLCNECAAPISGNIGKIYHLTTKEEFDLLTEIIINECKKHYDNHIIDAVNSKIFDIYKKHVAPAIARQPIDKQSVEGKVTLLRDRLNAEAKDAEARAALLRKQLVIDSLAESQMLTTGYDFCGYTITKYLGIVSGEVVLGTGFLSEFSASFSDLFGGQSDAFANKLESAKNAAMKRLIRHSAEKGGNAVIGLDFDYITFSSNIIGVVANGTSVVIEKVD